jgi:hypothetical protein
MNFFVLKQNIRVLISECKCGIKESLHNDLHFLVSARVCNSVSLYQTRVLWNIKLSVVLMNADVRRKLINEKV